MIGRLKSLFSETPGHERGKHEKHDLHVAAAALMIEAANMDSEIDDDEIRTIRTLLLQRFGFSDDELDEIIDEAARLQEDSNQLVYFTRAIKEHFDEEERVEMIEMLWEVAYADGEVDHYEANLLRRVAGLIYVSDRDSGAARKRVAQRQQAGTR